MTTATVNATTCSGKMERPRYFPRQLITPAEMNLEQDYFREKLRRHNRLMHGWGVVCGALVCPVTTDTWKVRVGRGYVLGPYGDEILIDQERVFDLRTTGVASACGEGPGDAPDPWCADVYVKRNTADQPLFVAVKYKEVPSRPVPVQPASCGCSDTQCEYSRWCDGYEIGIVDSCPDAGEAVPDFSDLTAGFTPKCPDCPKSPWVVLAEVQVDANGVIQKVDNCSCRRLVLSFGSFWWDCAGKLPQLKSVDPGSVKQGTQANLTISGANIQDGAQLYFGPGVTVSNPKSTKGGMTLTVDVAADAPVGDRIVTVVNPDCSTMSFPGKFRIDAKD